MVYFDEALHRSSRSFPGQSQKMTDCDYTLHKVWDTPPLTKLQGIIKSDDYEVAGKSFRLVIFPPKDNVGFYSLAVALINASESLHTCEITVKVIGRKKKEFTKEFSFSKKNLFCKFDELLSPSELKVYSRKDKLTVDFTISHNQERPPDVRKLTGYVGIINKSATCYMNSILEMLYHIPAFRRLIYSIPITEDVVIPPGKDITIPYALQRLFCLLQFSPSAASTDELIKSFGWHSYESFVEHDVQEFIRVLISNLEDKLKGTELDGKVAQLFRGKLSHYIKCINVNYCSSNDEDFYDLSVVVRGFSNLNDSLASSVADQLLNGDNQYSTDDYGKQDALMGSKICLLPPVLHIHLARFEYSATSITGIAKIADRFEFPPVLDLSPYVTESFEGDTVYELFSVLVHLGSNMGGHYMAYCRPTTDQKWYHFNDASITEVTQEVAINNNFGSSEKSFQAYYLCYIRQSDIKWVMQPVEEEEVPSKLIEYYDRMRDTLDPKMTSITVVNLPKSQQKFSTAKDTPYLNLLKDIKNRSSNNNIKELWKLNEDNYPIEPILPKDTVQQTLNGINRVFASECKGPKNYPALFRIDFFFKNAKDPLQTLGYMAVQQNWSLEKIIDDVNSMAGFPSKTKLKCYHKYKNELTDMKLSDLIYNQLYPKTAGSLIFELDKESENTPTNYKFPDPEPGLVRARYMIPEIKLDTVERYLNHSTQCIKIMIYDLDERKQLPTIIEIPYSMHIKILIRCIRGALEIGDNDSVLLFQPSGNDNTIPLPQMLNYLLDKDIETAFSLHSNIKEATAIIKRLSGIKQDEANKYIHLRFPIFDDQTNEKAIVELDISGDKTVKDLFEYLRNKSNSQYGIPEDAKLRLVAISKLTILRTIGEEEQLNQFLNYRNNEEFRVEIIPDSQLELDEGSYLIRCAFSYRADYPPSGVMLTPFYFDVIKDEPFGLTAARITSFIENDFGQLTFILYSGPNSVLKFIQLTDEIILSEFAEDPGAMLYIVLQPEVVYNLFRQKQNSELKIYK